MSQIIMGWSKCSIHVGNTGANDAMCDASKLKSLGTIKDKSSTIESSDGDTLEMKATGGEVVGYEVQEGGMTLTTRIIEPTIDFYKALGFNPTTNEVGSDNVVNSIKVSSHICTHEKSVVVTPDTEGAWGIKAPKCSCSFKFGWSEEDGNYVDVTFGIIKSATNGYWYERFQTPFSVEEDEDDEEEGGTSES